MLFLTRALLIPFALTVVAFEAQERVGTSGIAVCIGETSAQVVRAQKKLGAGCERGCEIDVFYLWRLGSGSGFGKRG